MKQYHATGNPRPLAPPCPRRVTSSWQSPLAIEAKGRGNYDRIITDPKMAIQPPIPTGHTPIGQICCLVIRHLHHHFQPESVHGQPRISPGSSQPCGHGPSTTPLLPKPNSSLYYKHHEVIQLQPLHPLQKEAKHSCERCHSTISDGFHTQSPKWDQHESDNILMPDAHHLV